MQPKGKLLIVKICLLYAVLEIIISVISAFQDDATGTTLSLLVGIISVLFGIVVVATGTSKENAAQGAVHGIITRSLSIEDQLSLRRDAIKQEQGPWVFGLIILVLGLAVFAYNFLYEYLRDTLSTEVQFWMMSIFLLPIIVILLYYYRKFSTIISSKKSK